MIKDIKFNDVPALRSLISDEFGEFGEEYLISQEMIMLFADLTNDHQWIHVDVERARAESPFGDTIAHGFLTLALATTLRPKLDFNITGYSNAMNYGIDQLRFLAPVIVGSSVHACIRFDSVEEKSSGTLITLEMAIHVVGSGKPSIIFKWKLLYRP
ncbi:MaoC family dehydratase [Zhongshania aquimaris]|uniref:MaoC family dehydratase n=1 Tax=Zhongshania aquimaris TaxID=2857107 RepID=A0ABS6VSQ4_9GAMM|nr:MaoC family dehydratase [Zhongshania aquimaris]MBW2941355.1 MaoC family dehydratase [Zhongshania aquimaris]